SSGSCGGTATVTCNLGTIANGAHATVTIVVRPTAAGSPTNSATVAGAEQDPTPDNNSATATTTVTKASPSIATQASAGVSLGGSLFDTATLSGGVVPSGTITFRLYGPNDANCSGSPVSTSTASVVGNGSYISGSFTPTAVGTYRWVASYGGDANNNAA